MTKYTDYFTNMLGAAVVEAAIRIAEELRSAFHCCRGRNAAQKKLQILTEADTAIQNWAATYGVSQIYFQEITGFCLRLKRFLTDREMTYGINCGAWEKAQKRQRFYLA